MSTLRFYFWTGDALTLSLSDSVTASDAVVKASTLAKSDSVTASDSAVSADAAAHGDSVTTSDSIATTAAYVRQIADTATVSDAISFSGTAYQPPPPPVPTGAGGMAVVRRRRPQPQQEAKDYELELIDLVVCTDRLSYEKAIDPDILREEEELLALI